MQATGKKGRKTGPRMKKDTGEAGTPKVKKIKTVGSRATRKVRYCRSSSKNDTYVMQIFSVFFSGGFSLCYNARWRKKHNFSNVCALLGIFFFLFTWCRGFYVLVGANIFKMYS